MNTTIVITKVGTWINVYGPFTCIEAALDYCHAMELTDYTVTELTTPSPLWQRHDPAFNPSTPRLHAGFRAVTAEE